MRYLLLFLFVTHVVGEFVVIPPSLYMTNLEVLTGKQSVTYTVTANLSISVFLMDYAEFYQYTREEAVIYDYGCSRLSVKAANVTCDYRIWRKMPKAVSDVYFVIKNESNESAVSVNYTLKYYSESTIALFMLLVFAAVCLILIFSCGLRFFLEKRRI